ncbi:hypothetical protein VTO73DRAFT_11329 [Trametes versicolor]
MAPSSKKTQAQNRVAANYIAYGPRGLPPALQNLDPEQRLRLAKSSQKIGKVLGEMPVVDVLPASPGAESLVSTVRGFDTRPLNVQKKGKKAKKNAPPPAPVMRYRLPATRPWEILVEDAIETSLAPPRPIPAALNLSSPSRIIDNPRMSVFHNGFRKTPLTPEYLSPLTPLSPLSPIKTPDIHEHRMQTLRRLARMSRAFRDTIYEELVMPSVGIVAAPDVQDVNTYLDLYRKSICPPRRSQMLTAGRRRSRSVGDTQRRSVLSVSVYSASTTRTSFLLPQSAVPARLSRVSYVLAIGSPALSPSLSASAALDDSPLQQQQSVAQAMAVILGADAQVMESFRRGFAMRSFRRDTRRRSGAPPGTPLMSPFAAMKSPKVPYWVRSGYRARDSAHAAGRRRRAGASRPPPTPRTMRKERRQGWGGTWDVGKMGAAVEKLKEAEVKARAEEEPVTAPEMPVDKTTRDAEDALLEALGDMEREQPLEEAALADITEAEEESLLAYLQEDAEDVSSYAGIEEEAYAI